MVDSRRTIITPSAISFFSLAISPDRLCQLSFKGLKTRRLSSHRTATVPVAISRSFSRFLVSIGVSSLPLKTERELHRLLPPHLGMHIADFVCVVAQFAENTDKGIVVPRHARTRDQALVAHLKGFE